MCLAAAGCVVEFLGNLVALMFQVLLCVVAAQDEQLSQAIHDSHPAFAEFIPHVLSS